MIFPVANLPIRDPFAVLVAITFVAWFAIWIETRVTAAKYLGSVLIAILLATLLGNIGFLPSQSDAYGWLGGVGISLGIAFVLLGVDFGTVKRAGPAMLIAFGIGAVATAAGAFIGALLLNGVIGPETWKLAGQYTGTYTGGSVNFVAVGAALDTSPEMYTAAIAADNVMTTVWVAVCLIAPAVLAPWWQGVGPAAPGASGDADTEVITFTETARTVTIHDLAVIGSIGIGAVWFSEWLGARIPHVPAVLWLTTMVLIVAQTPFVRGLSGAPLLGNYVMHLFLATIGAQSILAEIMRVGPAVLYFTIIVVGVHGVIIFGVGRLARIDLPTLAVASQANIGGPASALAVATAKEYPDRLLPGVAVGLLGYAVGTYSGLGVAAVLRGMIGS